jgi:hypothetical protein
MRRSLPISSCVFLIAVSSLFGQGATLVGAGYANPMNIRVSPGQITTVFVSGLTTDPTKPPRATNLPLPTSLAGISVTINQSSPTLSVAAPLLAVEQLDGCNYGVTPPPPVVPPDCRVVAITLQIPYELSPQSRSGDFAVPPTTELVITANGAASKAFSISTFTDNLHVLSTCDAFPSKQSGSQIIGNGGCNSVVTHADGTLVTADAPGKPGETVVIYAYGLGRTTPAVKTGEATPSPAPVLGPAILGSVRTVTVQFDFRPNAEPSNPYLIIQGVISPTPITGPITPTPTFVGLTPGQVGLYQINLPLPSTFPATLPCSTLSVCNGNLADCSLPILSNVTIDIGGVSSFGGAAICVQPPQ